MQGRAFFADESATNDIESKDIGYENASIYICQVLKMIYVGLRKCIFRMLQFLPFMLSIQNTNRTASEFIISITIGQRNDRLKRTNLESIGSPIF